MTEPDTIVVFTARSPDRIVEEGGSQAWKLNPARAKLCKWLVCTQNRHNPDHEFSDATEPHGAAFLVGKVSGIAPSPEGENGRWMVAISEYARIDMPDLWDGGRNPVRYATIDDLGIEFAELQFQPMPVTLEVAVPERSPVTTPLRLTIEEAKQGLAATFGVNPEAVEITIRG